MDKQDVRNLYKIQKQNIKFRDSLGEHTGIIHTLEIKDSGIYAYALFFGMNVWLRLNETTMEWEEVRRG